MSDQPPLVHGLSCGNTSRSLGPCPLYKGLKQQQRASLVDAANGAKCNLSGTCSCDNETAPVVNALTIHWFERNGRAAIVHPSWR